MLGKARQQLAGPAQYPHKVSGPREQGRGHSMALQAHGMWPHRKGKPYPNLGLSKKDKVSLCPPQYPIPSLQVRMTLGKKTCKMPPMCSKQGRSPSSLQVAQGFAQEWETPEPSAKHNLKFRPSETTHSLSKALQLFPTTTTCKVSFPNATYNYKQAKPNIAQMSPPLLWGEGKRFLPSLNKQSHLGS